MRRVLTYTAVCLLLFIIGADSWSDGWGATKKPWEVDRARWGIQAATAEAWSPSDIVATTLYWWRADQGVTYGSAAPACTSWTDIVAGKVAYAAAAANEPAWYTGVDGINGHPVIQGVDDDYLKTAAFASAIEQPFAVWAVATVDADNDNSHVIVGGVTALRVAICNYAGTNNCYQFNFGTSRTSAAIDPEGTVVYCLVITEHETNKDKLWINGVLKINNNAGGNTLNGVTLLAYYDGTLPSNAKLAEVGIVKTATGFISAADEALLEAYVTDRYAVAIAFYDGYGDIILCQIKSDMTDPMMMFLTLYNFQGRSRW